MCNQLHEPYRNIPEEGVAWKLFSNGYKQLVLYTSGYQLSKDNWVVWDTSITYPHEDGFCMFATEEDAKQALLWWRREVIGFCSEIISQVEYKKGLGICKESYFISDKDIDVLIAKEFRIVKKKLSVTILRQLLKYSSAIFILISNIFKKILKK